jgi:putative transposase
MDPPTNLAVTPHRKCLRRADVPGDARLLTFSCFQRQAFLSRGRCCEWFLDALERSRRTHGFDLWAFVLMPEHVHLLIYPGHELHRAADMLYTLKKSVTNRALAFIRREAPEFLIRMEDRQANGHVSYRFWQRGGGYDENLYTPAKIWGKIDYIHANPVRRGLCERPTDWKWSSARAYEHDPGGGCHADASARRHETHPAPIAACRREEPSAWHPSGLDSDMPTRTAVGMAPDPDRHPCDWQADAAGLIIPTAHGT